MSVYTAVESRLANSAATELELAMALALAKQVDGGFGAATAVKELRALVAEIESRQQESDGLDELAKARNARLDAARNTG